jgi:hypothetical protein
MNKETLEEAAGKYAGKYALSTRHISYIGFEDGANWQAERMYSEEDLRKSFHVGRLYQGRESDTTFEGWFEQLKK